MNIYVNKKVSLSSKYEGTTLVSVAKTTKKNETTQTVSTGLERKGREARIQKTDARLEYRDEHL